MNNKKDRDNVIHLGKSFFKDRNNDKEKKERDEAEKSLIIAAKKLDW